MAPLLFRVRVPRFARRCGPLRAADLDPTRKGGRPLRAREMRPVQHGVLAKGNAALVFITGASAERASHQMASQNSVLFPIGNTTHTRTHTHTPPPPHTASETLLEKATFHLKSLPPLLKKNWAERAA